MARILSETGNQLASCGELGEHIRQALAKNKVPPYWQSSTTLDGGSSFSMTQVALRLHEEEKAPPPGISLQEFKQYALVSELARWVCLGICEPDPIELIFRQSVP